MPNPTATTTPAAPQSSSSSSSPSTATTTTPTIKIGGNMTPQQSSSSSSPSHSQPSHSHSSSSHAPSSHQQHATGRYMWKIAKFTGKAPSARFSHATCTFLNHQHYGHECMLVFGGWDGLNMLSDLYMFNLVTQEWSNPTVSGMIPTPRAGHSCTTLILPHFESLVDHAVENLEKAEENAAEKKQTKATTTTTTTSTEKSWGQKMILIGGGHRVNYLSDIHVLDLESWTWSRPMVKSQVKVYIKDDLILNQNLYADSITDHDHPETMSQMSSSSSSSNLEIHNYHEHGHGHGHHELGDRNNFGDHIIEGGSYRDVSLSSNTASNQHHHHHSNSGGNGGNGGSGSESEQLILRGSQTAEIIDTGFGTPSQNAKINNRTIVTMKEVYPAPRSRHSIVVVHNKQNNNNNNNRRQQAQQQQQTQPPSCKIIIFGGGGSQDKIFDDLWVLNSVKMEWSQPKSLNKPSKRWGHSAVLVENRMYIFGGVSSDSRMLNDLYEMDTDTYQWRQITLPKTGPVPAPRAAHTCTLVHDKYMFVLWGGDDNRFLDDLLIIDLEYVVVKRLTFKTPKARCAHTSLLIRDKTIYVFGGGDKSTRFKELYMLDVDVAIEKSGIVEAVAHLPKPVNLSSLGELLTPTSPETFTSKIKELTQERMLDQAAVDGSVALSSTTSTSTGSGSNSNKISSIQGSQATLDQTSVPSDNNSNNGNNKRVPPSSQLPPPSSPSQVPLSSSNHPTSASSSISVSSSSSGVMPPPPPPLPPKMAPPVVIRRPTAQLGPTTNQYISVRSEIRVDDTSNSYQDYKNQQATAMSRRRPRSMLQPSRRSGPYGQDQQVYSAKDAKEITNWLVSLGLGRYAAIFTHEEIDMDCLSMLTEADLFRIGVNKYGPRKKILAAAREFSQHDDDTDGDDDKGLSDGDHHRANSFSRQEFAQSGGVSTGGIPPPPPVSVSYPHHTIKQHDRQLNQLSQAVSNLSMAIEGMNEAIKTMSSSLSMLIVHQQQQMQHQHQHPPYMMDYMMHHPVHASTIGPQPQPPLQQQQPQLQQPQPHLSSHLQPPPPAPPIMGMYVGAPPVPPPPPPLPPGGINPTITNVNNGMMMSTNMGNGLASTTMSSSLSTSSSSSTRKRRRKRKSDNNNTKNESLMNGASGSGGLMSSSSSNALHNEHDSNSKPSWFELSEIDDNDTDDSSYMP